MGPLAGPEVYQGTRPSLPMRFVTPLDRVIQAGGDWVTMLFWLLAVAGAAVFAFTDLPAIVSIGMIGAGMTVYWMRLKNLGILDLLVRIGVTSARDR